MFERLAYWAGLLLLCAPLAHAQPQQALTVYGEAAKYPDNFQHFDYVNPDAPKGGSLSRASNSSADFWKYSSRR